MFARPCLLSCEDCEQWSLFSFLGVRWWFLLRVERRVFGHKELHVASEQRFLYPLCNSITTPCTHQLQSIILYVLVVWKISMVLLRKDTKYRKAM